MLERIKPSVRFYFPKNKQGKYDRTKVSGIAGYRRKFVRFNLALEAGLNADAIASNQLNKVLRTFEAGSYVGQASRVLSFLAERKEAVILIVQKCVDAGVWEKMNANDLSLFVNLYRIMGNESLREGGIADEVLNVMRKNLN